MYNNSSFLESSYKAPVAGAGATLLGGGGAAIIAATTKTIPHSNS